MPKSRKYHVGVRVDQELATNEAGEIVEPQKMVEVPSEITKWSTDKNRVFASLTRIVRNTRIPKGSAYPKFFLYSSNFIEPDKEEKEA